MGMTNEASVICEAWETVTTDSALAEQVEGGANGGSQWGPLAVSSLVLEWQLQRPGMDRISLERCRRHELCSLPRLPPQETLWLCWATAAVLPLGG